MYEQNPLSFLIGFPGNVVRWEQQCRFKHMTCRKYLRTDGKTITLTENHTDPKTVFRLHPVIKV